MPSDPESDDRAARRERADTIRRLRDKRNASLNAPDDSDDATSKPAAEPNEAEDAKAPGESPNYVDFIDRKMRQPKKD